MFLGQVTHHTGGRRHGQGSSPRCKWRLFDTGLRINHVCEAKLNEMNDHEREQHQESDGRMQLTTHRFRRQLLITSPLQNK